MKNMIMALFFTFVLITIIPTSYADSQTNSHGNKSHIIYIAGCPMKKSCFTPCQITIEKGDIVTWVNRDTVDHRIMSGSGQRGPDGWFSSPSIPSNGIFSHTFDRKGAFTYYDDVNPYAQGVVIVDSLSHTNFVKLQQSYFSDWWCTK